MAHTIVMRIFQHLIQAPICDLAVAGCSSQQERPHDLQHVFDAGQGFAIDQFHLGQWGSMGDPQMIQKAHVSGEKWEG